MKPVKCSRGKDTVRQAVAHTLTGCVRLLHERTILVLLLLFCLGMGCMLWDVSRLQSNLIASIALQDASLYAQALAEFRTLYTSEVVETVRPARHRGHPRLHEPRRGHPAAGDVNDALRQADQRP